MNEPIDMILYCPKCDFQHIDKPESKCGKIRVHLAGVPIRCIRALGHTGECSIDSDSDEAVAWDNPPHKIHLCARCQHLWQPALVRTNGVQSLREPSEIEEDTENTFKELQECYDILLRTARRCARDLRHAIDNIPATNQFREMMTERLQLFRTVFADVSEYRIRMHLEMDHLESDKKRIEQDYLKTADENGELRRILQAAKEEYDAVMSQWVRSQQIIAELQKRIDDNVEGEVLEEREARLSVHAEMKRENEKLSITIQGLEKECDRLHALVQDYAERMDTMQEKNEKDHEGWRIEAGDYRRQIHQANSQIEQLRIANRQHINKAEGSYWAWQGDGEDHLESLVCPILIPAKVVREMFQQIQEFREVLEKCKGNACSAFASDSMLGPKPFVDLIYAASKEVLDKWKGRGNG